MTEISYGDWNEDPEEIRSQLIELFLNVKVRSKDEISEFDET